MEKRTKYNISFVASLIIMLFSAILYLKNNMYWFYPAPFGFWLFFDSLSYFRKKETTLNLIFKNNISKFVKLYFSLLIVGILFEFIGSIALNLWSYKLTNYVPTLYAIVQTMASKPLSSLGWLIYPIMLMHIREMYEFIGSFLKNAMFTTILSMLLGILIWEIPNVFPKDWVYSIPFVNLEVLGINVIVIIGWVILIKVPLYIYELLGISTSKE